MRVHSCDLHRKLPITQPLARMVLVSTMSAVPTSLTFRVGTQTRPFSEPLFWAPKSRSSCLPIRVSVPDLRASASALGLAQTTTPQVLGPQSLISRWTLFFGLRQTP